MKNAPILGAHVSIAGGLTNAIDEGTSLGCQAIQIFTKNNRQWSFTAFSSQEASEFIAYQKTSSIEIVISHASYLINLASPNPDVYTKSYNALHAEMLRCDQLKIPFLVLHPGAHLTSDKDSAIQQVAHAIDMLYQKTNAQVRILLENMAGQGSTLGSTFEELAALYNSCNAKARIGFCFDTCHAFAAGYDLQTEEACIKTFKQLDQLLGHTNIYVFHLNDSKTPVGSHVDRHEHIGEGYLGTIPFRWIMQNPSYKKIIKIIETPQNDRHDHKKNLTILRSFIA